MIKYFFISILFILSNNVMFAQSYYEGDVKVVESNTEDFNQTEEEEEMNGTYGKYVKGDTLIDFNGYSFPKDSVDVWKKDKKYKWINRIENQLKSNKEKQEKENESDYETNRKIGNTVSTTQNFLNSTLLKTVLWILALVFVFFIVYQLFLNKGLFVKNSTQKNVAETEDAIDENNMDTDFDSLSQKAFKQGDYRLAMRYMFLGMLKKLDNRNHIKYFLDKTNTTYAAELPQNFRDDFSRLALYYEYIWYGKFEIDEPTFLKIETAYKNFNNKV